MCSSLVKCHSKYVTWLISIFAAQKNYWIRNNIRRNLCWNTERINVLYLSTEFLSKITFLILNSKKMAFSYFTCLSFSFSPVFWGVGHCQKRLIVMLTPFYLHTIKVMAKNKHSGNEWIINISKMKELDTSFELQVNAYGREEQKQIIGLRGMQKRFFCIVMLPWVL